MYFIFGLFIFRIAFLFLAVGVVVKMKETTKRTRIPFHLTEKDQYTRMDFFACLKRLNI